MNRRQLVLAALAFVTASCGSRAEAGFRIRADSPKPAVCDNVGSTPPGAWVQNRPCGYYIGTAMGGWSFEASKPNEPLYSYGRIYGDLGICGWLPPNSLEGKYKPADLPCSEQTKQYQFHRLSFGRDFNAGSHDASGGTPILIDTGCARYFNYFTNSNFESGVFRDPAPPRGHAVARYRYTTRDGKAIVVLDDPDGWVFLRRSCAAALPPPFNDND